MLDASEYVHVVRPALEKLAGAGRVTYYKDLGAAIGKPARWTLWKAVLDEISYDKPDLSIIVLNATTGWPGQIAYKALSRIRVVSHGSQTFATASAIELQISCAPARTRSSTHRPVNKRKIGTPARNATLNT